MSQTTEALISALVRRAARTAPSSLSARLEEEWLADMQERTSGLSRLRFAVGCYWASVAIGLEHPTRQRRCGEHRARRRLADHRAAALLFVSRGDLRTGVEPACGAFCGLMMAGTKLFKPVEPPAIQPRVIDQPPPPIKAPPVDTPRWFVDEFTVLPKLPPVDPPEEPILPKIVNDPPAPPQPPGTIGNSPPREIVRVQGGTGTTFPHPDDYYPDASRRSEEQGAAVLRVCVDAAGRLTSDPVSTESSGSGRLDAAAIKLAKAGSGHYRPTTEDGRPVAACYPIKIRFQLRN